MRIAMIGLGKMGSNMARRLCRRGIEVVGYNRSPAPIELLAKEEGLIPASSLVDAISKLSPPRVVWLMLPAGETTEGYIDDLGATLAEGDLIVDGGNANFHDSRRRGTMLSQRGIGFCDVGTSGGVWGLDNGYCMMAGGAPEHVALLEPVLKALAPTPESGWGRVGPVGAGHYAKMIHNGIEYGMMQAYAEGLALMRSRREFALDLAQVTELWRHGSVVRSWLLDLTAEALAADQTLEGISPYVADSGEGRWTAIEAIEQGVAAPVMSLALQMRFLTQDPEGYGAKLLSLMRNAFGGHTVVKQ